ncbi:MAG: glutamate---cysteine ligase / carboxylate-amine ligase [Solirubrobacteraceae bacterium]|nr:glutamate---cysteine ligase / carboxylate-amine ligase [Solirubrobacteraceae bacterium]
MLLDPITLDLAPCAAQSLAAMGADARFKLELVTAQLKSVTSPKRTVAGAASALSGARRDLHSALQGATLVAGAGMHPFAATLGELNDGLRYEALGAEFASVARRQLVFGLHVHVAVSGAARGIAVHERARAPAVWWPGSLIACCAPDQPDWCRSPRRSPLPAAG